MKKNLTLFLHFIERDKDKKGDCCQYDSTDPPLWFDFTLIDYNVFSNIFSKDLNFSFLNLFFSN